MASLTGFFDQTALRQVALTFGTPTYVYSEKRIRQNCSTLKQLFSGLPVNWLYAIKANDNPHILRIIQEEGFGFDTVSFEEALLASHFVQHNTSVFYTENNMTDAEMHDAVKLGVQMNIGSYSRLEKFAKAHPGSEVCIRVKPDIGDGHHSRVITGDVDSKFGIRLDLLEDAIAMAKSHKVSIVGIHIHIGSGIQEPANLKQAMIKLLDTSAMFPELKFINFGGGIPIPYKDDEAPFDVKQFEAITRPLLEAHHQKTNGKVSYWFEPGRYIVADAGALLTTVNTIKDQGRITFLGTDTGFNHLVRPVMYESYHRVRNISKPAQSQTRMYTISGNICESGDVLAEQRTLPITEEGDVLMIMDAGAYGMTMASHYNRRVMPAEVIIQQDGTFRVIRPREEASRYVQQFLQETGYSTH